ncbi:hypothetical protein Bpfe_021014 [Biomphalaria pfeifferi]|uniref:Uncharacterized protein n=1 Tax=Biomphalaria pfeifferi TaxID=112525 RepID=A0AAD8B8Q8_BIOPF|nr:hypothetical protein Bpfe_021014 [Biomphalaria pfeifferi]
MCDHMTQLQRSIFFSAVQTERAALAPSPDGAQPGPQQRMSPVYTPECLILQFENRVIQTPREVHSRHCSSLLQLTCNVDMGRTE